MHMTKTYENLQDMLEKEIVEIEKKGQLDPQSLENLNKLMTTLKNTEKCIEYEEEGTSYANRRSYGRGRSYGSYDEMSNRMMPHYAYDSYDSYDRMSMARRGRDGDGDGRYNESRDNFRDRSYRGRESYENSYGYSRDNAKKKMVEKLTTLMDDTMSEQERTAIMDCIDKIK